MERDPKIRSKDLKSVNSANKTDRISGNSKIQQNERAENRVKEKIL